MEAKNSIDTGLKQQAVSTAPLRTNIGHFSRKIPCICRRWLLFTLCLPLMGLLQSTPLFTETLFSPVKNKTTVRVQYGAEQDLPMKTDEGLLIYLDNETRFLEKIHLELTIPDALKKYCDGLAVNVYSNLQPVPEETSLPVTGRIDAKKIFFAILPYTNRTFIQIPVQNPGHSTPVKAAGQEQPVNLPPGTLGIAKAPQMSDFPLLLLIQPIMKGMPDNILSRDFFINIKPELANKGILQISLLNNKEKIKPGEYILRIDEAVINPAQTPLILEAGMHKLRLESRIYKESIINFSLNPGEQKELQLALESDKTTLQVEAPADATIFFDGNKLSTAPGEKLEVEPGEHIIRFKMGNYSNSKKVVIQKGKKYTINLILDIAIKED